MKQTLVLRDTGVFSGAGTGRKWVIEYTAKWTRVAIAKCDRNVPTGETWTLGLPS